MKLQQASAELVNGFGFQHYRVFDGESSSPDFIALGKGLGNGYPIEWLAGSFKIGKDSRVNRF